MCGIAGYIDLRGNSADLRLVSRMVRTLEHRGPDGEGTWAEGPIGLGHRRLAIIDKSSAGQQPMLSSNGRFVLTYNGEVYNFRELRQELESLGIRFVSASDSEVVLEALSMWGPQVLSRFNGMFALALWDRHENRLLLARDRYGIKPLYWSNDHGRFCFASENKAILAVDSQRRDVDPAALAEYLSFQNFFSDRTLLTGVNLFPAGNYATLAVHSVDAYLRFEKYWDFQFNSPSGPIDEGQYTEELQRLLIQAVERQLVSDVEIGTYLSGGIDSATTASIASRSIQDLKSFTCGFDLSSASGLELGFDERTVAEALSARFKTEHYEMVLKAGDMERCMPQLTHHLEEPRVGQSYPNFYAAKLASRFVSVVLSGTGGDEIFGGYPWRYFHTDMSTSFDTFAAQYFSYWQRLLNEKELTRLLRGTCSESDLSRPRDLFTAHLKCHPFSPSDPDGQLNSALYLEAKTFLQGLLVVEDKLSMAHSLESRVPFLDNDLVDFATRLPASLKVTRLPGNTSLDENLPAPKKALFENTTASGKQILRNVAREFLPDHVAHARKQGFSAPDASWFRGESIRYVEKVLIRNRPLLAEYLDFACLKELVDDHLSGRKNRRLLIWSFLSLEHWLQRFT